MEFSSFQKEIWLANQNLSPNHPGLFTCGRFLIHGHIDMEIARKALRQIIRHFPLLSAGLSKNNADFPTFTPNKYPEPKIIFYDTCSHEHPEQEALRLCTECIHIPYKLFEEELIRFVFVRFSEQEYYFLSQSFHVIHDGLFNSAVALLLSNCYAEIAKGKTYALPDIAAWQNIVDKEKKYAQSQRGKADRVYWQETVKTATPNRIFPPLAHKKDQLGQTALHVHLHSSKAEEYLHELSANLGGTHTTLSIVHALCLYLTYDVITPIAMTINNGERKNPFQMQGYMLNLTPIIPDINPELSLHETALNIAAHVRQTYKHSKTSVSATLRDAGILKNYTHLWDTGINYIYSFRAHNSHFQVCDDFFCYSPYDRALLLLAYIPGIEGSHSRIFVNFSKNHFTHEDIRIYCARFEKTLELLATQGDKKLNSCSLILAKEYELILQHEQGKTIARAPISIPHLFENTAKKFAENTAIQDVDGKSISYAQLFKHVRTLAKHLQSLSIKEGDVVAVLARRHLTLPQCILAIMHLGAIYLPIDPEYPQERIEHILEDSGARHIITLENDDMHLPALNTVYAQNIQKICLQDENIRTASQDTFSVHDNGELCAPIAHSSSAAYMIYTSGSTGKPKGVLLAHAGFVNMILEQIDTLNILPSSHVLQFASPAFDASLSEIFMALLTGATLYPVPRSLIDTPLKLHAYMQKNTISVATFPPSYLAVFDNQSFPSLVTLLTAGEPPIAKNAKHYAAELNYFNAYGPTELSVCASMHQVLPTDTVFNVVGKPIANTAFHILDSQGRRVAPGKIGELWVSGMGVALGYHNRPELTQKVFRTPTELEHVHCYATGDRAAWTENGEIMLFGRNDSQIKLRGHRVELGEIENILEEHPKLEQATVLLIQNEHDADLEAFLVPKANTERPSHEELYQWLMQSLPSYSRPGFFHYLPSMPLTPNGKVDNQALQNIARENALTRQEKSVHFPEESAYINKIYSQVLGYEVSDTQQDFFNLGGDSLKAMKVLACLQENYPMLSMYDFINNSSILALHTHLKTLPIPSLPTSATPITEKQDAPIPFTAAQLALWAQELARPKSDRYHMPYVFSLQAKNTSQNVTPDVEQFIAGILTALNAQPLCTSHVHGPIEAPYFLPFSLPIPTCSRYTVANLDEKNSILEKILHQPFQLTKEVPLRFALLHCNDNSEQKWLFVLVMHHIIADAIGFTAILEEAIAHLNQRVHTENFPGQAQRAHLLRKAAEQEQLFLQSASIQKEISFWKEKLFPLPPAISKALTGYSPHSTSLDNAGYIGMPLDLAPLQALAQKHNSSLFTVIIGLLASFLCEHNKLKHCILTIPMGTRNHSTLHSVCSYFTNAVPLRLSPAPHSWSESIENAKTELLTAIAHSAFPSHILAKELQLSFEEQAGLFDVFVTHMDMNFPSLPAHYPLDIQFSPTQSTQLKAAKAPLSFMFITKGEDFDVVLEYAENILNTKDAHNLMHDFVQFIGKNHTDFAHSTDETTLNLPKTATQQVFHQTDRNNKSASDNKSVSDSHQHPLSLAWQKILGYTPNPTDNFFLQGGDSIKAIQLVGHLHKAGIEALSPSDCFAYPIFSELCTRLAELEDTGKHEQKTPNIATIKSGEKIALPPLHTQWVQRHPKSWKHFYMPLPVRLHTVTPHTHASIDIHRLQQAFFQLAHNHEALRLNVHTDNSQDAHFIYTSENKALWLELDNMSEHSVSQAFALASKQLFNNLSATDIRPTYGCAHFIHNDTHYALLGFHHFFVDIISLEILRAELIQNYENPHQNTDTSLTLGAASYAKILQSINENSAFGIFTDEEDFLHEVNFWHKELSLFPQNNHTEHGHTSHPRQVFTFTINDFHFQNQRRGAGLAEILAGLSVACTKTRTAPLLLTLESHGREQLLSDLNITHTVGWFTAAFPFAILPEHTEQRYMPELADFYAQKLESLPMRGARFAFAAEKEPQLQNYAAQISLNYVGRNLQSKATEQEFLEPLPHLASPNALPHVLSEHFVYDCPINISIFLDTENCLHFSVDFDSQTFSVTEIESLLKAWEMALHELVDTYPYALNLSESMCTELSEVCQCASSDIISISPPDSAEEAMLFQYLLDQESNEKNAYYTQQICFNLRPENGKAMLDEDILLQAWHDLCRRHEALRMLFAHTQKHAFVRVILKEPHYYSEQINLVNLSETAQEKQQSEVLSALRLKDFNLTSGPVLFFSLFRRKDTQGTYWEMAWTFPHILMDGWCIGIMLEELEELYMALKQKRKPNLAPAPSLTKVHELIPSNPKALKEFWSKELHNAPQNTGIVDILNANSQKVPHSAQHNLNGTFLEQSLCLDAKKVQNLKHAAATYAVTLPQLIQGLWALLLSSAGQKDVVYGMVMAARLPHIQGMEKTLGLFLRTLPIRVQWYEEMLFKELALALRQKAVELVPHTCDALADILKCYPGGNQEELFDHLLVFENYPLNFDGSFLGINAVQGFERTPYPLILSVYTTHDACHMRFTCNTNKISSKKLELLINTWQNILDSFINTVQCHDFDKVSCLQLCALAHASLHTVEKLPAPSVKNDALVDFLHESSLHGVFLEFLQTHPHMEQEAAYISANNEVWSYGELLVAARRIAKSLTHISAQEPVGIAIDPRKGHGGEHVACMLGILMAGGCYLTLDLEAPKGHIVNILNTAQCHHIIFHDNYDHPLYTPDIACSYTRYKFEDFMLSDPLDFHDIKKGQRDIGNAGACLIFTSGTTGTPKGILIPHQGILRLFRDKNFQHFAPLERIGRASSPAFDFYNFEIWLPLLNGATVCSFSLDTLTSIKLLQQDLLDKNISTFILPTGLLHSLAAEKPDIFSSLKYIYTGGEVLNTRLANHILKACPHTNIFNGYGPAENSIYTMGHWVRYEDTMDHSKSIPIGLPLTCTQTYIVEENGNFAPDGAWGELCIGGLGLAPDYYNNPTASKQAFRTLAATGERVYYSGDLVRKNSHGLFEFGDRKDNQVKIRGYRVETSHIEQAFLQLSGIKHCAVIVSGERENKALIAFVLNENATDSHILQEKVRAILPEYMCPQKIIHLQKFPLTNNGKLDRKALHALIKTDDYMSQNDHHISSQEHVATIQHIFSKVLQISLKEIEEYGTDADFFDLGGQSLKAVHLLSHLNNAFKLDLRISQIMKLRNIGQLAQHIQNEYAKDSQNFNETPEVTTSLRNDTEKEHTLEDRKLPLLSTQRNQWFMHILDNQSSKLNVVSPLHIHGLLDTKLLQYALNLLEMRHEALRIRVSDSEILKKENTPTQWIAPTGNTLLKVYDLRAQDCTQNMQEYIQEAYEKPFVFQDNSPLFQAYYCIESNTSSVLMLVAHHIGFDGWSMNIIAQDLNDIYKTLEKELPSCFEEAKQLKHFNDTLYQNTVSYAKLILQRHKREESVNLQALAQYFTPLPEPLLLPTDFPRLLTQDLHSDTEILHIPAPMRDALCAKAQEHGVTFFSLLLSLMEVFCYRHTGQEDFVLGVPIACREHTFEKNCVGLFMNVLPLRVQIHKEDNIKNLILRTTELFANMLEYAEYPLDSLLKYLKLSQDQRAFNHNPLYNILFSFDDLEWTEHNSFGSLSAQPYTLHVNNNHSELCVNMRNTLSSLEIHIQYKTSLFTKSGIERMGKRLIRLAESILAPNAASLSINTLHMLSTEEEKLLDSFNDNHVDWDLSTGIYNQFAQQARKNPKATALFAADGTCLTYADFEKHTAKLATWLWQQGVRENTPVCIALPRSSQMLTAIFATLRLQAYYVPIPLEIDAVASERIESMLQDLPDTFSLLTLPEHIHLFEKLCSQYDKKPLSFPHVSELENMSDIVPQNIGNMHSLAYIIFTSGSTGKPKGVMVRECSVLNRLFWMQATFPLDTQSVILQKTPISFDVSVWELFWWSWYGASLALLAPGEEREPGAIVAAIEKHKVTHMHFVPSMLHIFLEYLAITPQSIARVRSLHSVFVSGEAIGFECVQRFNSLLFESNGTQLHNLYGPTEATVDVTWQPCSPTPKVKHKRIPDDTYSPSIPIGKAISNTTISIVDAQGQRVPVGVTGQLIISGIQVAEGYSNRQDLTDKVFFIDEKNPDLHRRQSYRSGDLARYTANGSIEYLGRMDDQVKVHGVRIELGEVEAALESSPLVSKAVVRLNNAKQLATLEAFILPQICEEELTITALRAHLQKRLPSQMIPTAYYIMDELTLSAHGKVNRKQLTGTRLALTVNAPTATVTATHNNLSLAHIEKEVRSLWYTVLPHLQAHEDEKALLEVNFFDAGGSSLLLIKLHSLLNQRWPNILSVAELFVSSNIREQAQKIYDSFEPEKDCQQVEQPQQDTHNNSDIAIIGIGLRLADYDDVHSFWTDLITGSDRLCTLPEHREHKQRAMLSAAGVPHEHLSFKQAAYLDDIAHLDVKRFGMAPSDARILEPEQRLFLSVGLHALENAGYGAKTLDNAKVGIFVGASARSSFKLGVALALPEQAEQSAMLNVPSALATRLSHIHNWTGSAAIIDTACSSGLVAIHTACTALRNGDCDLALCGAVRIEDALLELPHAFSIESSSKRTYSFEERGDGTTNGEGGIAFLLKPLSMAMQDNDAIHAVIRGSAVNQDGRGAGLVAPNPLAQAAVIAKAAHFAHIQPSQMDFIEAHGTGTTLGDPIEIDGLRRAFAENPPSTSIPISSVKGNFGHLDAAAGALGLLKAILILQYGHMPPQAHFQTPNPHIDFKSAHVHVPHKVEKLTRKGELLLGGVSSFGLSGINAHLIIQEAPQKDTPPLHTASNHDTAFYCLPFSANSEQGLRQYVENFLRFLESQKSSQYSLQNIAATLCLGREHLSQRVAFVAQNIIELNKAILHWLGTKNTDPFTAQQKNKAHTEVYMHCQSLTEAEQAANAFMQGATPLWQTNFARVHLPAVPLERTAYWPHFTSTRTQAHATQQTCSGTWLGSGTHTAQGISYDLALHNQHFWPISEHKIMGRSTLVGMALPSLLTKAIAFSGGTTSVLTLRNISWQQPLMPDLCHHASLLLNAKNSLFQLGGEISEQWVTFAQATYQVHTQNEIAIKKQINIKSIHQGLHFKNLPTTPENTLFEVSQRWNARQNLWISEDKTCVVSYLKLPSAYLTDLVEFPWHPALLDLAVSSALIDEHTTAPPVLAACKSMHIYHALPEKIWIRCLRKKLTQTPGSICVDCDIYDDNGHTLLSFEELLFMPLRHTQAVLHCLNWENTPETILATDKQSKHVLVLSENEYDYKHEHKDEIEIEVELQRQLAAHTFSHAHYPQSEEAAIPLIQRMAETQTTHIICILPKHPEIKNVFHMLLPIKVFLQNMSAFPRGAQVHWTYLAVNSTLPEHAAVRAALAAIAHEDPRLKVNFVEIPSLHSPLHLQALNKLLGQEQHTWLRINTEGELSYPSVSEALPILHDTNTNRPLSDSCIVISGGLGGLALALAEQIVPELGSCLALLHKSPFPAEEIWDNWDNTEHETTKQRIAALRKLRNQGIPYRLYQCDVSDYEQLSATLAQVRRECAPIGCVIHSAGFAGDGFFVQKSSATFHALMQTKLQAARFLHELTQEDSLQHFILISSRTALAGAAGQSDYAAANAAMDSYAHELRSSGFPALSLALNTLADVGMAARAGISTAFMLPPSLLGQTLLRALAQNRAYVLVSMHGEIMQSTQSTQTMQTMQQAIEAKNTAENSQSSPLIQGLKNVSISEALCTVIQRALEHEHVTENDDFYALGGDSLSGMRIITALNELWDISLSLTDLLTKSRLKELSAYLADYLKEQGSKHHTQLSSAMPEITPQLADYPVGREQKAVLLDVAVNSPHTGYNLSSFFSLPEAYELSDLENALQILIARHEILRTHFIHVHDLQPRMCIFTAENLNDEQRQSMLIQEHTFKSLDEATSLVRPFNVEQLPLWRMALVHITHLPESTHNKVLFFDIHHSICDAKGLGILMYEFFALLRQESLPANTKHMKDMAWKQYLEQDAEKIASQYWLDQYKDAHELQAQGLLKVSLPCDYQRPPYFTFQGAHVNFFISPHETEQLREFAKVHKCTLNSLIHSLWILLIYADTHNEHIILGLATDTRTPEFAHCVGMLACLLPTRTQVNTAQKVTDFIQDVHINCLNALQHAAFSESDLLTQLRLPADPSCPGISQVVISYMSYEAESLENTTLHTLDSHTSTTDLSIYISHKDKGLFFSLLYYSEIFSKERIQALSKRFKRLMHSILTGHLLNIEELLTSSQVREQKWQAQKNAPVAINSAMPLTVNTQEQAHILAIFREYFPDMDFDADGNFFELGGHSLLAIQIVNGVNKHYGTELTARDLFTHPTARLFSRQLSMSRQKSIEIQTQTPLHTGKLYPLSHAQQRLYVLHCMQEKSTAYNMVLIYQCLKPLHKERLEQAMEALATRHAILRTLIVEKNGQIFQKITDKSSIDCTEYSGTFSDKEALGLVAAEAIKPFDLSKTMLRLCLCNTEDGKQYFAIGMHHIIGDGWSIQILSRELLALYENPGCTLPPLPMQYVDYALLHEHKTWHEEKAWWRQQLYNMPEHISLPQDAAQNVADMQHEGTVSRMLNENTLYALRKLAAKKQVSLASYLLSLLAALLFKLSRQNDIIIGMGVAGRDQSDLEGLIGFFVNMIPIRIQKPEDGQFDSLLSAVYNTSLEAVSRQSYPYDLLVRDCVQMETDKRHKQLFNVVFEYQRYTELLPHDVRQAGHDFIALQEEEWLPLLQEYWHKQHEAYAKSARYALTFYAQDDPTGLRLRAHYDSALFTEKSVSTWLALWEDLMEKVVNNEA